MGLGFSSECQSKFRGIGLAKRDHTRGQEALYQFTVLGRHETDASTAHGHRLTGELVLEIFQQKRYAGEGPFRQGVPGDGPCTVVKAMNNGIERRVEPVCPGDRCLQQFTRGDLPLGNSLCLPEGIFVQC